MIVLQCGSEEYTENELMRIKINVKDDNVFIINCFDKIIKQQPTNVNYWIISHTQLNTDQIDLYRTFKKWNKRISFILLSNTDTDVNLNEIIDFIPLLSAFYIIGRGNKEDYFETYTTNPNLMSVSGTNNGKERAINLYERINADLNYLTNKYIDFDYLTLKNYMLEYVDNILLQHQDLVPIKFVTSISNQGDAIEKMFNFDARGYSLSGISKEVIKTEFQYNIKSLSSEIFVQYSYEIDGEVKEHTFTLPSSKGMFIIPMQAIVEGSSKKIYGPYIITSDSIFIPRYKTYTGGSGIQTVLSDMCEIDLFNTKYTDPYGFEYNTNNENLFIDATNYFNMNSMQEVIAQTNDENYYSFLNSIDGILYSSSNDIEILNDISDYYESFWIINYFKQIKNHYLSYDEVDWEAMLYQVPRDYLSIINYNEFRYMEIERNYDGFKDTYPNVFGTDHELSIYKINEFHYNPASEYTDIQNIHSTLAAYNLNRLKGEIKDRLNVYIPVLYNDENDDMIDFDNMQVVNMTAYELMLYYEIKNLEYLDEDGYGNSVRSFILNDISTQLEDKYRSEQFVKLNNQKSIDIIMSNIELSNFFYSGNILNGPNNPSKIINNLVFYGGASVDRFSFNPVLARYYNAMMDIHGRSISLSNVVEDVLYELHDIYETSKTLTNYYMKYAKNQLLKMNIKMSEGFFTRFQNIVKTSGRNMNSWYDDMVQNVRHKIWSNQFYNSMRKINGYGDFYSLIYFGSNTGSTYNSIMIKQLYEIIN